MCVARKKSGHITSQKTRLACVDQAGRKISENATAGRSQTGRKYRQSRRPVEPSVVVFLAVTMCRLTVELSGAHAEA
jgi:hypothetical protein